MNGILFDSYYFLRSKKATKLELLGVLLFYIMVNFKSSYAATQSGYQKFVYIYFRLWLKGSTVYVDSQRNGNISTDTA